MNTRVVAVIIALRLFLQQDILTPFLLVVLILKNAQMDVVARAVVTLVVNQCVRAQVLLVHQVDRLYMNTRVVTVIIALRLFLQQAIITLLQPVVQILKDAQMDVVARAEATAVVEQRVRERTLLVQQVEQFITSILDADVLMVVKQFQPWAIVTLLQPVVLILKNVVDVLQPQVPTLVVEQRVRERTLLVQQLEQFITSILDADVLMVVKPFQPWAIVTLLQPVVLILKDAQMDVVAHKEIMFILLQPVKIQQLVLAEKLLVLLHPIAIQYQQAVVISNSANGVPQQAEAIIQQQ